MPCKSRPPSMNNPSPSPSLSLSLSPAPALSLSSSPYRPPPLPDPTSTPTRGPPSPRRPEQRSSAESESLSEGDSIPPPRWALKAPARRRRRRRAAAYGVQDAAGSGRFSLAAAGYRGALRGGLVRRTPGRTTEGLVHNIFIHSAHPIRKGGSGSSWADSRVPRPPSAWLRLAPDSG